MWSNGRTASRVHFRLLLMTACWGVFVVGVLGCAQDQETKGITQLEKTAMLPKTSLGVPLVWPADFDPNVVWAPRYSPDGRHIAFDCSGASPACLSLVSGELRTFHGALGLPRECLHGSPQWASDDTLLTTETCITEEQRRKLLAPAHEVDWGSTRLLVRITDGLVTYRRDLGPVRSHCEHVLGRAANGEWLFVNNDGGVYRRLLESDPPGTFVTEWVRKNDERHVFSPSPSLPWISKLRRLLDAQGESVRSGSPIELECLNVDTGETMRVADFPRPGNFGVLVSADGRWVFAASRMDDGGWSPIVYDVSRRECLDLPGESWVPMSLNEVRGVLLVGMLTSSESGSGALTERGWAEIPLGLLLGER
jgi:hypothetical protein